MSWIGETLMTIKQLLNKSLNDAKKAAKKKINIDIPSEEETKEETKEPELTRTQKANKELTDKIAKRNALIMEAWNKLSDEEKKGYYNPLAYEGKKKDTRKLFKGPFEDEDYIDRDSYPDEEETEDTTQRLAALFDLDNGKAIHLDGLRSNRYFFKNALNNSTTERRIGRDEAEEDAKKDAEEKGMTKDEYDEINNLRFDRIFSTAIDTIDYDPNTMIASVKFVNGDTTYEYPGVPPEVIKAWLEASSKGRFYHKNVAKYSLYGSNHLPKSPKQNSLAKKHIDKIRKAAIHRGE